MASESKPSAVTSADAVAKHQRRANDEKTRQLQTLNMQKENILSQRTSNPGRRAALAAALEQIEAQIASLG